MNRHLSLSVSIQLIRFINLRREIELNLLGRLKTKPKIVFFVMQATIFMVIMFYFYKIHHYEITKEEIIKEIEYSIENKDYRSKVTFGDEDNRNYYLDKLKEFKNEKLKVEPVEGSTRLKGAVLWLVHPDTETTLYQINIKCNYKGDVKTVSFLTPSEL